MLSSILNSDRAIEVIQIMRTFGPDPSGAFEVVRSRKRQGTSAEYKSCLIISNSL